MLALAALAVPAAAMAVATPVSPPRGARVSTLRATLSWRLPADESSFAVYVAKHPAKGAGRFANSDLVDARHFGANADVTSDTTRPLYARRYWWIVESVDATTSRFLYSRQASFRVLEHTRAIGIRLSAHGTSGLRITALWSTNSPALKITERILRNGVPVWTSYERRSYPRIGGVRQTISTWNRPSTVPAGSLLKLEVTVAGLARAARTVRYFRAP